MGGQIKHYTLEAATVCDSGPSTLMLLLQHIFEYIVGKVQPPGYYGGVTFRL